MSFDLRKIPGPQDELNKLLLGELLGEGQFRRVYASRVPSEVIKLETTDSGMFCNVQEWSIWQNAEEYPEARQWLAPCIAISHSGSVLIQARTKPLRKMPAALPDFFADVKLENLGLYKGRVVAHDYGNHRCFEKALRRPKMWKVVSR